MPPSYQYGKSSPQYDYQNLFAAKEGIYMNSVDTGWVTNENPFKVVESMANNHLFKCPLDCVDGAMRVLDPIYAGVLRAEFPFG